MGVFDKSNLIPDSRKASSIIGTNLNNDVDIMLETFGFIIETNKAFRESTVQVINKITTKISLVLYIDTIIKRFEDLKIKAATLVNSDPNYIQILSAKSAIEKLGPSSKLSYLGNTYELGEKFKSNLYKEFTAEFKAVANGSPGSALESFPEKVSEDYYAKLRKIALNLSSDIKQENLIDKCIDKFKSTEQKKVNLDSADIKRMYLRYTNKMYLMQYNNLIDSVLYDLRLIRASVDQYSKDYNICNLVGKMFGKCKSEENEENKNSVRTLVNIKVNQTIQHASIYLILASVYYKCIQEYINTDSMILNSLASQLEKN